MVSHNKEKGVGEVVLFLGCTGSAVAGVQVLHPCRCQRMRTLSFSSHAGAQSPHWYPLPPLDALILPPILAQKLPVTRVDQPTTCLLPSSTHALTLLLMLSCMVGTLFISYTIKTFGSLVFATIMTTRQFLSILLSCLLFAHPLSAGQWCVWLAEEEKNRGPGETGGNASCE